MKRGKPGRPQEWPRLLAQAEALRAQGFAELADKLAQIARGADAARVFGQFKGTTGRPRNGWLNSTRAWVYLSLLQQGKPEAEAMRAALTYFPNARAIQPATLLRFIELYCPKDWPKK
jgi:hypothetical protein